MYNDFQYIAFRHAYDNKYEFYKWDAEQGWYLKEDNSGNGFSLKRVEQNKNAFLYGNSHDDLKKEIFKRNYSTDCPDFHCPKCGFGFEDTEDFEYSPYEYTIKRDCICGQSFEIQAVMTYKYKIVSK